MRTLLSHRGEALPFRRDVSVAVAGFVVESTAHLQGPVVRLVVLAPRAAPST